MIKSETKRGNDNADPQRERAIRAMKDAMKQEALKYGRQNTQQ